MTTNIVPAENLADVIAGISDHYFVPYPQRRLIADAILSSDWLQSLLATAGADQWDAGCRVGFEMHEEGYDEPQLQWNPNRADSMEGKAHDQ